MATYKTQAIIINRLNLGESDRILTLFSPEQGKIRAICKGSRKTKSKYGGHTELFSLVDFVITTGKNLDIVTDASLCQNFLNDKPDMEKIKTAYYFAEIIGKLIPDSIPNKEIFDILYYCLNKINLIDEKILQLVFVAKLLKILGIYPELGSCVRCETKPDKSEVYFSKGAGGILDRACSVHFEDSVQTDENTIKLWRYVVNSKLDDIEKLSVDRQTIVSANVLAISYIHCVTLIDYKSLRVLS